MRLGHELGDLVAKVLLDLNLAPTSLFDKVLKVSLNFAHDLLETVTICCGERGCDLARGNQICLEDLEVLAEASNLFVDFFRLHLVHDLHRLDLHISTFSLLLEPSIHLTSQLVLIEAVFISQTLYKLTFLLIEARNCLVLLRYQVLHELVLFSEDLANDIIALSDHVLHLVVALICQFLNRFVFLRDELGEHLVFLCLQLFNHIIPLPKQVLDSLILISYERRLGLLLLFLQRVYHTLLCRVNLIQALLQVPLVLSFLSLVQVAGFVQTGHLLKLLSEHTLLPLLDFSELFLKLYVHIVHDPLLQLLNSLIRLASGNNLADR